MSLSTHIDLVSPFFNPQYSTFQTLWKPTNLPSLFIVRAPQSETVLTESLYLELMQTRLDQMIQVWAEETSVSATHRLLVQTIDQLDCAQVTPLILLSDDLSTWRQEWANLLIHDNWRFQERVSHHDVISQLTHIEPNQPDYADWADLHDNTTLEEWLTILTA